VAAASERDGPPAWPAELPAKLPPELPIEPALPRLLGALGEAGRAVLEAPPGAGKTTRVPLALLEAGLAPGRILMLEPRRVAARAAAERLAASLGEEAGRRVGYRIRGESRPGSAIEVVTEGVLTRMLQSDPGLEGIGAVLFDEIHERALQADLGLALTLEVRGALRPDLLVLAMSATLDAGPIAAVMGGAPVITAEGRAFPVETVHLDRPPGPGAALEPAAADLILRALAETRGGLLAFLPGAREIRRTAALLAPRLPEGVALQPLHGSMPFAEQRAALAPLAGARKLVLATAIAETSLTIPDVRVVVDAGRARRARFDPGSGMTRLVTERVTRAEAAQRRGRAGRVAPGRCYRLWTRGEEGALAPYPPPEIANADLTGLALEIALWGAEPEALPFLTPPPAPALAEARALLRDLGALDAAGRPTGHGRALAGLPVHPRLGHMLLVAAAAGGLETAANLAALIEARVLPRGTGADLAPLVAALAGREDARGIDPGQRAALRAEARRLTTVGRRRAARPDPASQDPASRDPAPQPPAPQALAPLGPASRTPAPRDPASGAPSPGGLLSLAYPDRIAWRRPGAAPRFLLSGGKGARLADDDGLAQAAWLVAADLDGDPREALIRRALAVSEAEIRALHEGRLERRRSVEWSRRDRAALARERLMLGAIALEDRPWRGAPAEAVAAAILDGVRDLGLDALPWTPAARRLQARIEWLRARGAGLPPSDDASLLADLDAWLGPWLAGMSRADDLAKLDPAALLAARLDRDEARTLDREAPAAITAPTGTRLPVNYAGEPSVSVRMQELFGLTEHPCVGPARTPLVLHLLSPAQQPVQTTSDLPGFWASSYAEVRRDLRGRYPRHSWPEDPAAAEPTRRAKPRGRRGT
jgi:ATP-dependent helicase HrpB